MYYTFMRNSKFLNHQFIGVGCITVLLLLFTLARYAYERLNPSSAATYVTVSGDDGGGRRGVLVLWLLLLFVFTAVNCIIALAAYFRRARR